MDSNYTYNDPVRYFDPNGKIGVDGNGNIIATTTGNTVFYFVPTGDNVGYNVTYEVVNIYTDNGTAVTAHRFSGIEGKYSATFEEGANQPTFSRIGDGSDANIDDLSANCHGYTFTDNALWINNDQVQTILENDGYLPVQTAEAGDAVVYIEGSEFVHTARVGDNGTFNANAGGLPMHYGYTSVNDAARGLNYNMIMYGRKTTDNKVIDTNLGTVDDNTGIRTITDKNEIEQFLNQLQGN